MIPIAASLHSLTTVSPAQKYRRAAGVPVLGGLGRHPETNSCFRSGHHLSTGSSKTIRFKNNSFDEFVFENSEKNKKQQFQKFQNSKNSKHSKKSKKSKKSKNSKHSKNVQNELFSSCLYLIIHGLGEVPLPKRIVATRPWVLQAISLGGPGVAAAPRARALSLYRPKRPQERLLICSHPRNKATQKIDNLKNHI